MSVEVISVHLFTSLGHVAQRVAFSLKTQAVLYIYRTVKGGV